MLIFIVLGIAILIALTLVILNKNKKETPTTAPPTTSPPTTAPPTTSPPTTAPPTCTKYKYNTSCLDNCGEKYVDEIEKKCYFDIPSGKYADGKTLLSSCGKSELNKILKGDMCVNKCNEFLHEPLDLTLDGECKSTCDGYHVKDIVMNNLTKICLKASDLARIFDFDNVKINDYFSRFIITAKRNSDVASFGKAITTTKEIIPIEFQKEENRFIDFIMSSSGSVYAAIYEHKVIIIDDMNNFLTSIEFTDNINLPPMIQNSGYNKIKDFNFCGRDNLPNNLTQGVIIFTDDNNNLPYVFTIGKTLVNGKITYPIKYFEDIFLQVSNDLDIYKPEYLGIKFMDEFVEIDSFSICFSRLNTEESGIFRLNFDLTYPSDNSPIEFSFAGETEYNYPLGNYEYLSVKPTFYLTSILRLSPGTGNQAYNISLNIKHPSDTIFFLQQNIVSNIAVGSKITNSKDFLSTNNPRETEEIVYFAIRESNTIKIYKFKYTSPETISTKVIGEITVDNIAETFALLSSNTEGSILTVAIYNGNDEETKNFYKYDDTTNTFTVIF